MRRLVMFFACLAVLACAEALTAKAASFDCTKAAKPDEMAICATPDISALDSEMSGLWFAYGKVPMLMGSNGARMDEAQGFLRQRGACGGDVACLRKAYHARIAVLRQSLTQAMDNYFQLQNADPMVAPWSVTTLPAPVGKIAAAYDDECKKLGGALKDGFTVPRVMTVDLDGDAKPDFVLDPQNLQCSAAATAFCGNGGCQIRIAISDDNYAKPVEVLGGQPTLSLTEAGAVLDVWVDGSNCKSAGPDKTCWASYAWKDGKLAVTYVLRPLME